MSDAANVVASDHPRDEHAESARFGVFELDLRAGELRREGVKVKLQDQPLRLLRLLIENAGEIVTREELRTKLWPDEFVDFDHSLNAAVRKLRAALDDSADNPRFVETLARRGYRFIAPVQWSARVPPAAQPVRTRRPAVWIAAAIALVAIVSAIAVVSVRRRNASRAAIDGIAVLPFAIDGQQSRIAGDGLTELIIDGLSTLPNLRVMARTTMFRYTPTSDPVKVAHELDVRAVVSGSVRRDHDQYTVRVELIDGRDGSQLWGRRFSARTDDLPSIQRDISEDLSTQLRRGLTRDQRQVSPKGSTTNPRAYDAYLWGLHAWNRRTIPELQKALAYFNEAIRLDPQFASAYAGVADVYGVLVGYGQIPPEDGSRRVLEAARRALQFDPDNAEALTAIATTEFRNLWDFAAADRDYRRAIAANPSYPTAHQWYADLLRDMGRFDDANREVETAYKLDPFSPPINAAKCASLYYMHRYQEAIEFSRRLLASDKELLNVRCYVGALVAAGKYDDGLKAMRELVPVEKATQIGEAYVRNGRRDMLEERAASLSQEPNAEWRYPVTLAEIYAQLGDRDRAFAWLEKAYNHRASQVTNIGIDPELEPIRDDPRYAALLKRIGLPDVHIPPPPVQ